MTDVYADRKRSFEHGAAIFSLLFDPSEKRFITVPESGVEKPCVYVHREPDGTIFYIGNGKEQRARDVRLPRNLKHAEIVLKHGADKIIVDLYPWMPDRKYAYRFEAELIRKHKPAANGKPGGQVITEEKRRKLSDSARARHAAGVYRGKLFAGHHHSETSKAQIGQKMREYFAVNGHPRRGKPGNATFGFAGKVHSEASKAKMSVARARVWAAKKARQGT